MFFQGSKGPGPNLTGSSENISPVKQPAVRNRFSKHQICYSRSTPLQQNRRDHIDEIEYSLVLHPLALYPHLEESVPPEVCCKSIHIFLYILQFYDNQKRLFLDI